MAATVLGQALADFGLSAELARVSVAHPSRGTIARATRAIVRQAPLALVLAPALYFVLGPTSASPLFLTVIGVDSALLAATAALTAVLQGLGDFRSPASRLGSARFLSAIGAITAAAIHPDPVVIIGSFALGECIGLLGLAQSIRHARARLPALDHPEGRLRRERGWLGVAVILNMLTSQGDSILVASILSPTDLGLFATASTLENGVATLSLAAATPVAFRSFGTTLGGDPAGGGGLLRRAVLVSAAIGTLLAIATWLVTVFAGDAIDKLSGLAAGDGPLVLALCLTAGPLSVVAGVWLLLGIGFGRHRAVGTFQIQAGVVAIGLIVGGAQVAGAVGAAAGTVLREIFRVIFGRRLTVPSEADVPARPLPVELG
jgi:O-antigen/teichoic acid export membrane protein